MKGFTVILSIVLTILIIVVGWTAISYITESNNINTWAAFWWGARGFCKPYVGQSFRVAIPFSDGTIGIPYLLFNLLFYLFFPVLITLIILGIIKKSREEKASTQSTLYSSQKTSPVATSYSDSSCYSESRSYSDYVYSDKYTNQGASYYTNYGDANSGAGKFAYSDYFYNDRNKDHYSDYNNYSEYSSECC